MLKTKDYNSFNMVEKIFVDKKRDLTHQIPYNIYISVSYSL